MTVLLQPDYATHMMRHAIAFAALLSLAAPAVAQEESFGAWRLSCTVDRMTDRADCRLSHRDWVEAPTASRPGLALDIVERGGRAVPIVVARDLGLDAAARGWQALTGTAQLRFPPNRLFDMPCGLEGRSLVCAPRPDDTARAAEELLTADRALVRMGGFGSGSPVDPTEMRLADTTAAIAALRARQPEGAAVPPPAPGLELRDILQRLQRLLGQ
ncbi:hypothetical protein ACQW02_24915 [Humitalea sp. 24SJ18S-53]|uniref:hypothetical protein n=1 Tax=Humitalea sp. 24SJ18S-53 TaxID=3422307 RepID=UPI003D6720CE